MGTSYDYVAFDPDWQYMFEFYPKSNDVWTVWMTRLCANQGLMGTAITFEIPGSDKPTLGEDFEEKMNRVKTYHLRHSLGVISRVKDRYCANKLKKLISQPDWKKQHPVKLQALVIYALRKKLNLPRDISSYLYKKYLRGHKLAGCLLRLP